MNTRRNLHVIILIVVSQLVQIIQSHASCKYREESRFKTHGTNAPNGSSGLLAALERYENIHASCHRKGIIKDLLRPIIAATQIDCRYIYIDIDQSGLGNRIMVILSYFLLALLTDRVLLLKSNEYIIDEIFCQPFKNSDWLIPRDFNFFERIQLTFPVDKFKYVDNFLHNQWVIFSEGNVTDPDSSLHQRQIWYLIQNEQYIIPSFFRNPSFYSKLLNWFPDRNVATPLTHYLLKPADAIWDEIVDSYLQRNQDHLSLGLHLRYGFNIKDPDCFRNIPEYADIFMASPQDLSHMKPSSFYEVYGVNGWKINQKYKEMGDEKHDMNQAIAAVHDIWLLSLVDKVILSARSTFSYVIMSLRGEACLYYHGVHQLGPGKCIMFTSHEPCCHSCGWLFFPTPEDKATVEVAGEFMSCEDISSDDPRLGGTKLVVKTAS